MNNEELEQSLRTEIDNHLKSMFAEMRQEVAELQTAFDAEFDRHRAQIRESLDAIATRSPLEAVKVDEDFARLVAEHLNIAREDGANQVAAAMANQEQPEIQPAAVADPSEGFARMGAAINDISTQSSQAEILKTLVRHAGNFAARGALFIVKSEHLIGWRVFGAETGAEEAVREVFMPLGNDSLLTSAVKNSATEKGAGGEHADDRLFLEKLNFGEPEQMTAIPLVVRGRGVAVLYADSGAENETVHAEALEALVRVAGMTVEMLASNKSGTAQSRSVASEQTGQQQQLSSFTERATPKYNYNREPEYAPAAKIEQPQPVAVGGYDAYNYSQPETAYQTETASPAFVESDASEVYETENAPAAAAASGYASPYESFSFNDTQSADYSAPAAQTVETAPEVESAFARYNEPQSHKQPAAEQEMKFGSFDSPAIETFSPSNNSNEYSHAAPATIEAAPISAPAASSPSARRFGERNMDLPIEVSDDERRPHNDARRFARLLVSEIKLYNEQKVKEGREAGDLYERLREAVDRSREMYDKRVAPAVAAKFDYFNFEIVNTLAEGDETKLGRSYPGATA